MGLAEHRLHQLPRKANDKLGLTKALPHNNFRKKYTELTGYAVVRSTVRSWHVAETSGEILSVINKKGLYKNNEIEKYFKGMGFNSEEINAILSSEQ